MTKQEFLNNLRTALSGRVSASVVTDNMNYYEDYINTQMRMGRTEEEVIKELGDPRLLAKSISEASKHAGIYKDDEEEYQETGAGYDNQKAHRGKIFRIPGWLIILLVLFVILMIISLVFSIISYVAPVVLPVLLIVMLIRYFKRR